jgi:hypothetical protein
MPDTTWPINRHPPGSSRVHMTYPFLMSSRAFRHVICGLLSFAFIGSYLPRSKARLFPQRSARTALDRRTLGWFVASSCKATTEGHRDNRRPAPPSPVQQRIEKTPVFISTNAFLLRSWRTHVRASLVVWYIGRFVCGVVSGVPGVRRALILRVRSPPRCRPCSPFPSWVPLLRS